MDGYPARPSFFSDWNPINRRARNIFPHVDSIFKAGGRKLMHASEHAKKNAHTNWEIENKARTSRADREQSED